MRISNIQDEHYPIKGAVYVDADGQPVRVVTMATKNKDETIVVFERNSAMVPDYLAFEEWVEKYKPYEPFFVLYGERHELVRRPSLDEEAKSRAREIERQLATEFGFGLQGSRWPADTELNRILYEALAVVNNKNAIARVYDAANAADELEASMTQYSNGPAYQPDATGRVVGSWDPNARFALRKALRILGRSARRSMIPGEITIEEKRHDGDD